MTVLAVDLAAKLSAACVMADDYTVLWQLDSFDRAEESFIHAVTAWWELSDTPDVLVVEDLPHGLSYSSLIKKVCRLQGRFVQAMHAFGGTDDILFAAPRAWRAHYPKATRGTGSDITPEIAADLGYLPPDNLLARAKGKGGATKARKIATDYCAAYLIARWAIDMKKQHGTYDVPGTSRYATNEIRAKDFHAQNLR